MQFELIILDFDGTIAESKLSILTTIKETLLDLGLSSIGDNKLKELIGLSLKKTFEKITGLKGIIIEEAIKKFRIKYPEIAYKTVYLFPNVEETLKKLYENGIKLAIASNKERNILTELFKKLNNVHFFSFIAGEQDAENKKPAPDVVNLILKKFNVSNEKTLVVGDTEYDIEMGKRANCFTCAVTYGYNSIEKIKPFSPDFIIDEFPQLLDIILE